MTKIITIIWQTVKDRKWSLISYSIAALLFMLMFVSLYPSIQDQAEEFNELLEVYPETILTIFDVEEINFDTVEKFLAVEYYSIILPLMLIFLGTSFAGMAISREIEKGTAEILLSRPVNRMQIFFGRYAAGAFIIGLFTVIGVFSVAPFAEIFNVEYLIENHTKTAFMSFLFGLSVFSMAYMFSSLFSEKSKVYMISGAILFVMYITKIASNLKEEIADVKYTTFFYYFDPNKTVIQNEIDMTAAAVFIAVSVITTAIAAIWFNKRDIAI